MKVVSWDVGVVNLAYCIMEKQDNTKLPYKIYKWGKIDLLDRERIRCDLCDKLATWKSFSKNYCKIHKKLHEIPKVIKIKSSKCCKCKKNGTFQIENETYCSSHKNQYLKKCTLKKLKPITSSKVSMFIKKRNLYKELDNIPELLQVEQVLIENQPAYKNPSMKAIGECVFNYFLVRGVIDKQIIKSIKFISPSNKLKVNEDNTIEVLSKAQSKEQKYKLTKELGIKYTKTLLKNDDNMLCYMNSHKKKDDLADAFLQGCHYLSKN